VLLAGGQAAFWWTRGSLMLNSSLGYELNLLRAGQHIWGYTAIDLWSASLILLATERQFAARCLSHPLPVFLGRVSYGMYLFHLIVLEGLVAVLGRWHGAGNLALFGVYLAVLSAVCWLSYRYFEACFLGKKDERFRRPVPVNASPIERTGERETENVERWRNIRKEFDSVAGSIRKSRGTSG